MLKNPCISIILLYVLYQSICFGCKKKEWMLDTISGLLCKKEYHDAKERVIFSANLANHYDTKSQDRLVFSKIIANEGNDYNPRTGIFTCQIPGLYQFSWILHQTSGKAGLHIYLMRNNSIVFTTHIIHWNGNLPGIIYLKLKPGDTVWLKANQAGRKLAGFSHSTFSGMLV